MTDNFDPRLFFEPAPTSAERSLYDKYIEEYVKDFNPYEACLRVGFAPTFAVEYAKILMGKPYIQQKIADAKRMTSEKSPDQLREEYKALVRATMVEAMHVAPHQVRVAAGKVLAQMEGFDQSSDKAGDELNKLIEAFKDVAKALPD